MSRINLIKHNVAFSQHQDTSECLCSQQPPRLHTTCSLHSISESRQFGSSYKQIGGFRVHMSMLMSQDGRGKDQIWSCRSGCSQCQTNRARTFTAVIRHLAT